MATLNIKSPTILVKNCTHCVAYGTYFVGYIVSLLGPKKKKKKKKI